MASINTQTHFIIFKTLNYSICYCHKAITAQNITPNNCIPQKTIKKISRTKNNENYRTITKAHRNKDKKSTQGFEIQTKPLVKTVYRLQHTM